MEEGISRKAPVRLHPNGEAGASGLYAAIRSSLSTGGASAFS